jgi:hypothetical protein
MGARYIYCSCENSFTTRQFSQTVPAKSAEVRNLVRHFSEGETGAYAGSDEGEFLVCLNRGAVAFRSHSLFSGCLGRGLNGGE